MNFVNEVRLAPSEILPSLLINSTDFLDDINERDICDCCGKSRKYFCYSCYRPMNCIKERIPQVKLPFPVDIIKYPKEIDGKSTAAHAPILAPHFVKVYTFPNIPTYRDKSKVFIVFPGKKSVTLEKVATDFKHEQMKCSLESNTKEQHLGSSAQCCCQLQDTTNNCMTSVLNCHERADKSVAKENSDCASMTRETYNFCTATNESENFTNSPSEHLRLPKITNGTANAIDCQNCSKCELNGCNVSGPRTSNGQDYIESKKNESVCEETDLPDYLANINSRFSELLNEGDGISKHFPFERVIFIDSTWNQVQKINNDERLAGISRIELKNRNSLFWRFQRGKPRTYLSTIEAIYYFFVDAHALFLERPYRGEYDNLLFFFYFMYKKIHTLYDPKKLRVNTMS